MYTSFFSQSATDTNPPSGSEESGDDGSDETDNWIDSFGDWFGSLGDSFAKGFSSLADGFTSSITNLGNNISAWFENIKQAIIDLGNGLIDGIKAIFIPQDGFMEKEVAELRDRFAFADDVINITDRLINRIGGSAKSSAPQVTVSINYRGSIRSWKVLDMSWYAPYKAYGDAVLSGILIIGFIWRSYISMPNTIRGVGGSTVSVMKLGGSDE